MPQALVPGELSWLMEDLAARVDYVRQAAVLSADGLPLGSSHGLSQADTEHLAALAADRPDLLAALQLVIVGAYYTDRDVRQRLAYPGQLAKTLQSWRYPVYLEEGLLDGVLARGAIWRDPATGRTAVEARPRTLTPGERAS